MKPTHFSLTQNLSTLLAFGAFTTGAHAATKIWDGGASGTGTDLSAAANWNLDALPVANDILQWNGTAAGNLVLSVPNVATFQGGTLGYSIDVTALQTGSLQVDNASLVAANSFRLASITIANGAGAFTLGDGAGTAILTLGGSGNTSNTFTNNSANAATLASDLIWGDGNAVAGRALTLTGSGNWNMSCVYGVTVAGGTGSLALTKTGTGTLFMNAANATYTAGTTIGTGAGAGIIRATASQALGTGTVTFDTSGNGSTARLELSSAGGISLTNNITFSGRNNASVAIQNISGNNALSGTVTISTGGGFYIIQSDAGTLTLSGGTSLTGGATTGTRTVTLQGAGNGIVSGAILNGSATVGITKSGAGTWSLNGTSAYTGPTNINAGTLAFSTTAQNLGSSAFTVADNAALSVKAASAGSTLLTTASVSLGTSGTTTLNFDFNNLNTTAPLVSTGAFTGNGTISINLANGALLSSGTHVLLDYTSFSGAGTFPGGSYTLSPRSTGTIVNDGAGTALNLNVLSDTPKWTGLDSGNWQVGATGASSNWKLITAGTPTDYISGDVVLFDDTAAGTNTVNLTATLSPPSITVNNTTGGVATYTFAGAGKISGIGGITKTGDGTLILANTTANDNTGATTISAGTVQIGDGTTAGAGSLGGGGIAISGSGSLEFNRPDAYNQAGAITGTGTLVKNLANTVTLTSAPNFGGALNVNAGTLTLGAGGTLSGPVNNTGALNFTSGGTVSGALSGAGTVNANGGTVQFNGASANTNTGLTTVSGGILQLSNTGGTGVGGDVTITGTGRLTSTLAGQLASTATITLLGNNTDSFIPGAALAGETVANVIVNSSTPGASGGQIVMRNGMNVTGTATLTSGILGVASSHTATINTIIINSANPADAILRVAGSGGPSVLNVGSGGITTSGGEIQVKFNTNNQDATLNLGGDFTATGNVSITNGGYTGGNLNIVNLTGDRTFDIATGTTTTVAPSVGGPGILTKAGDGTLVLNGVGSYASTTLTGGTLTAGRVSAFGSGNITVAPGTTLNLGGLAVTNTIVNNGGTLLNAAAYAPATPQTLSGTSSYSGTVGGNLQVASGGTLKGSATFNGAVTIENGGIHSPGNSPGLQTFAAGLTYDSDSALDWEFVGDTLAIRGTDYDAVDVTGGNLTVTAGAILRLVDLGSVVDYASTEWDSLRAFTVIDHSGAGSSTGNFALDTSLAGAFGGEGLWSVANTSGDIILTWTPVPEPSTYAALAGLAALGLAWKRRRNRSAA